MPVTAPIEQGVRLALSQREGETLEVVSMPGTKQAGGGTRARAFTIPRELDEATAWVMREASRGQRTVSVSIGCLTPAAAERINAPDGWLRASGSRAQEEGLDLLLGYRWVAADLDPDKEHPETLTELGARLVPLPPPNALVSSGSGVHAWWALDRMVRPDLGRELLEALAAATQGDRGTAQPTRALRLPGTFNHKATAQRYAVQLTAMEKAHDPAALLAAAQALAPPPPEPEPPRQPQPPTYDGNDLKEKVRDRYDLAVELDRVCGPARRGDWSCFAHEDRTPSLRLVQGTDQAAICYGGTHPDGVGLRKDSGHVLDVFDVLAFENNTTTGQLLSELLAEERARQASLPARPLSPGLPGLQAVLHRTADGG